MQGFVKVNVSWLLVGLVVFFGVLGHAGRAEGHEAFLWVRGRLLSRQKLVRNSVR